MNSNDVEALQTLRRQLGDDLMRFAALDVRFFAAYVADWLRSSLELEDLEALVDQLDATVRVNGQRLLDGPPVPGRP